MNIRLRPVRESDGPFLFELYASTRSSEMALVPWTDSQKHAFLQMQFAAQKSSYAKDYPAAQHEIICRDDQPVGRLCLAREIQRLHILDITVASHYRNEGIGSAVLEKILREADQARKSTTIYVETFNPSVRLFSRLGFRASQTSELLILLERQPASWGSGSA
jgi:ribosomal protein S18 acetylase RimI-like enzyme